MGQSLVKNYHSSSFSTKNRNNLITEDIEEELYNYLGGICKNLKCNPKNWWTQRPRSYFMFIA